MVTVNVRHALKRASAVCMLASFVSLAWVVPVHAAATLVRTTGYDFNASGLPIKTIVEPSGAGNTNLCSVTETTAFDVYGRPTTVVTRNCNAAARVTAGAPDEAAAPTSGSDAVFPQRTSSVTYNTADPRFIQTSTDAAGDKTTAMAFDAGFGVLKSSTDPNNRVTTLAYDSLGRKTSELVADSGGTYSIGKTWTYEFCGAYGTPTRTCPTIGGAAGVSVVTVTPVRKDGSSAPAANGPYVRTYYDALGREIRTETQGFDGASSTLVYQDTYRNGVGDVVAKSKPYYSTATVDCGAASTNTKQCVVYEVDKLHRVTKTTQYIGGVKGSTTVTYSGLTVTVADPLTHKTVETKNVIGLQDNVKDAKEGVITHFYDPFGSRVKTTDPAGNVISAEYDLYGRKTKSYDPDMGVWTYAYDALGALKTQIDAKSQKTTLTYDAMGRMTKRSEPSLVSNWVYGTCTNGKGKLCEANTNGAYKRTITYNGNSMPTSGTTSFGSTSPLTFTTQIGYDTNWRVETVTYPGSVQKIKNSYTTLGYLKTVQDTRQSTAVTLWTGNAFDAAGRPTQFTYGNSIVTNESYFEDGRPDTIRAGASNSVLNLQHGYDLAGNLTSRIDNVPSTAVVASYTFDELNRVLTETRAASGVSPAQTISWTYKAIGNIDTRTEGGVTNTYNYNNSGAGSYQPHAVASVSGSVNGVANPSYQYDANGNMTSGANRSVTWTSFNMAEYVKQGTTTLSYKYDSEHERAKETYTLAGVTQRTTYYINPAAGSGLFYEDESGVAGAVQKFYVSAGNVTVAMITNKAGTWSTQYWHKDHLGSNAVTTNAAGTVIERLAYEPFGKRRQANGATDASGALKPTSTDRGFTEHEHMDEVGLINMNGRVYDPGLGRFMSADTMVPNENDSQDYNRYSYASNRPLNGVDPSGHAMEDYVPQFAINMWDTMTTGLGRAWDSMSMNPFDTIFNFSGGASNSNNAVTLNVSMVSRGDTTNQSLVFQTNGNSSFMQRSEVVGNSVGEIIDRNATASAAKGDHVATYGFAFLGTAWKYLGAEGVSQVYDKGLDGASGADKLGAGFELFAAIPGVKLLGEAGVVAAKETSYLYRGVSAGHPAIDAARQGRVIPGNVNGTVSAEAHNLGGQAANSPFTSWTRDPAIAATHAGKSGPGGVVLRVPQGAPSTGAKWSWEWSPDVWGESEVLMRGVRSGVEVLK